MRLTTLFLMSALPFSFAVATAPAAAQRTVAYDTVSMMTPAAISCGFCGGEKFGVVFRELTGGGGLRADEFPLTINSFEIAIASATVVLDETTFVLSCQGSAAGGTIGVTLEAYAGAEAPSGAILANPVDGPWAGEMIVFGESVELERSVETTPGGGMYNVMINTITIGGGAIVGASNTYVRVVATIPMGGSSSSCDFLSLPSPGAVGIRDDDGRIENEVGFIYAINPLAGLGGIPMGWHWNESSAIEDAITGSTGIDGDWLIRMDISPASGPRPDAGVPDAGPGDTGTAPDGGGGDDGGMPPTGCMTDGECAGGEVCSSGVCTRVSCASPTDCAGGTTCVDGRCRGLCGADIDCAGGEVCDTVAGYCIPAGGDGDGGCGCGVHRPASMPAIAFALFGLAALLWRRRR